MCSHSPWPGSKLWPPLLQWWWKSKNGEQKHLMLLKSVLKTDTLSVCLPAFCQPKLVMCPSSSSVGWDISPMLRRINYKITWWMILIQGGVKTCTDENYNSGILCLFLTLMERDSSALPWEINLTFGLNHQTYILIHTKGVPYCIILVKVFNQESKSIN